MSSSFRHFLRFHGGSGCSLATTQSTAQPSNTGTIRRIHTSPISSWDEYDNNEWYEPGERPMKRGWNAFTYDLRRWRRRFTNAQEDAFKRRSAIASMKSKTIQHELIPYEAQFVIIGGGIVGSSIAWWLKQRMRDEDMHVTIVESDQTFAKSATVLSAGGIRQQFSIPENVEMSLFGAEFMRNAGMHLKILDNDPPNVHLDPMGYLFLAQTTEGAETMENNWKMQTKLGAKVGLYNREQLEERFPFMNFDNVILGSYGLENEGSIDAWQVLSALREKNLALGVQYVKGRVEGFMYRDVDQNIPYMDSKGPFGSGSDQTGGRMRGVYITPEHTDASPRSLRAMCIVNAAGPWAGEVAQLAGCGTGSGLRSIPVPVEKRKRYVYVVHCPDGPGLRMPMLIDSSGVWCRRMDVGHTYICGRSPTEEEDAEIDHSNLDVDYDWFQEKVWPHLAARVPAFEKLKVKNAWAGYYDYNTFDQNAIIGAHPAYENFFQVCGFSGHGLQHAFAAARGFQEYWYEGAYTSINLRKFNFTRILRKEQLLETGIV